MGQIITYKPGAYCQMKLDSGERILISIAQTGIKISKLVLGGLVPTGTIWECGTFDPKMHKVIEFFADPQDPGRHPLDAIKDKLIKCQSIDNVRILLSGIGDRG